MINLPNESVNASKNLTKKVEKQSNQQVSSSLSFDNERRHHQIVPASTIKIANRKVPSINRPNHMNFMNAHSSSPRWNKHKWEKTSSNKINHRLSETVQNSNLISFFHNKRKIAPVLAPVDSFHYQSSQPNFSINPITTYPSFLYNIISPTSGHLFSAAQKYGPILSNPYLLFYNHVPNYQHQTFWIKWVQQVIYSIMFFSLITYYLFEFIVERYYVWKYKNTSFSFSDCYFSTQKLW